MRTFALTILAVGSLLTACGGGGSGDTSPATLSISAPRLTTQSHSSVSFDWKASGAEQFRVYRRPQFGTYTRELLAVTNQASFIDSGVGLKEAYTYDVMACRNASDPDIACFGSGPLEPFVVLGGLYAPTTSQVESTALAADFGLSRAGARWVFADPDDPSQNPTLDYTVRQLTSGGARISLTALDPTSPATNIGEIGVDGRLGVFMLGISGSTPDKTVPYLFLYDFAVIEPLFIPAKPAIGQAWTERTSSATNCERLDGSPAICEQNVVVTTRVVSNTESFASLCPRSPLAAGTLALKSFKIEKTHEYQARQPDLYKSLPRQVRQYWLAPGLGFVAARRTVDANSTAPLVGSGNYCLVSASGQ